MAKLAGDKRVIDTTDSIPYPYEEHMAISWIKSHKNSNNSYHFAVRLKNKELIGCTGIVVSENNGNLGWWIGVPYWNQGYCTEAVRKVIQFAFYELNLDQVWARCLTHNIPGRRVMEKTGMGFQSTSQELCRQKLREMSLHILTKTDYYSKIDQI